MKKVSVRKTRHILSLSGGKDSAALAVFMRNKVQDMEYVFCDTGKELPETYAYINKLEAFLGKPIVRLNPDYSFDYWLTVFGGFLPSANARWCTKQLKLKPFEKYCGDDEIFSYIGIRAEENRVGYISHKPGISPIYPFKDNGITKRDVLNLLANNGLGLPEYYKWRSRSGCYFCFYQRRLEWLKLKMTHPDLFEKAKSYEKTDINTGKQFSWIQSIPLSELEKMETQILESEKKKTGKKIQFTGMPLSRVYDATGEDDDESIDPGCLICYL
jgi:3'-phosphoadenosine 5'-phosphosulfate sulfotransferase (PAPS reductase)/FAD synthetase